MPDVYAWIDAAEDDEQERLADDLEQRAADPQRRAMLDRYLDDLPLPDGARVLDVGCGTGAVTRVLATRPGVGAVVGIDPSPVFVERAQMLAAGIGKATFTIGTARDLPFADAEFHAVVFHGVLSHVLDPPRALREAHRVTAPGGRLAVFDADFATATVALHAGDPLQACVNAATEALVYDRFLVRRLRGLVAAAGWREESLRSHGYLETAEPDYTLAFVDAGADLLARPEHKAEARRRAAAGEYFGHLAYASLIARRD